MAGWFFRSNLNFLIYAVRDKTEKRIDINLNGEHNKNFFHACYLDTWIQFDAPFKLSLTSTANLLAQYGPRNWPCMRPADEPIVTMRPCNYNNIKIDINI